MRWRGLKLRQLLASEAEVDEVAATATTPAARSGRRAVHRRATTARTATVGEEAVGEEAFRWAPPRLHLVVRCKKPPPAEVLNEHKKKNEHRRTCYGRRKSKPNFNPVMRKLFVSWPAWKNMIIKRFSISKLIYTSLKFEWRLFRILFWPKILKWTLVFFRIFYFKICQKFESFKFDPSVSENWWNRFWPISPVFVKIGQFLNDFSIYIQCLIIFPFINPVSLWCRACTWLFFLK
jgi:hypothetical protein